MESVSLEFVLIAVGVAANGIFAGSEIALVSARVSRLAELRQRLVRGAVAAIQLKEAPETFLATIQIAITAVGTLTSAVGGAAAVEALSPWLARIGLGGAAQPVALGIVILAITYVSLVVGELAPKAIALRDPERLACLMAPAISAISRISAPLVRLLRASTDLVLRVLGMGTPHESPFVSEEDVRYLIREGARKGIFERTEEELVYNVFEFADTTVREVMVPRPNIQGVDIATPADQVPRLVAAIGHSRIPVYRGDINHPVGILRLRDLLQAVVAQGRTPELTELLHPPMFIPETIKISVALSQFQQRREQLGVVVDEYGSVVGLLTVEDIVERVVGDIGERDATPSIRRLSDGALVVDGLAAIDDIRAAGVVIEDSPDYTTAAGFVTTTLGAIPTAGSSVTCGSHRWTVLDVDGPRVRTIRIESTVTPSDVHPDQ
jgi:putative hemolysin